jgi:uncharacterized protein (DUF362 family)/NAD-dependent dihydropyrimidine dehydrogenase PreA subunit
MFRLYHCPGSRPKLGSQVVRNRIAAIIASASLTREGDPLTEVYIARCPSYDPQAVENAFLQSMQGLPDARLLVQPGQRVLLKPNLLQAQPPERGITTHPAVVAAVARWVRNAGATPIIADSPGGLYNQHLLRQLYDVTGMATVARETGALLNYDVGALQVVCPGARAAPTLDALRVAVEADAIINIPKLKTHGLMQLTGAVKNLFGTVPGVIKGAYHARFASVERFAAMLVDIASYYRPILTVMDAVVAMEGDGPSGGDLRDVSVLLTSTDAVAVDVVAASIMGMPPLGVPTIAAAVRRRLATGHVEDIRLLGATLGDVRVAGFKQPRTAGQRVRMIPDVVPSWITNALLARPQAGPLCTGCGVCAENCPMQAITVVDQRARTDLNRCIRCYCCHELCPVDAVELHHSILGRLVNRL